MAKSRRKVDAIQLLKQDHKEVDGLFKQFEKLDEQGEDAVEQIIATACTELEIHDKLETEIFYPAVRAQAEKEEVEDLLDEAEVEHTTVRDLITKIKGMGAGDKKRDAHFTVLMEYVKHHVKEEEKEMFPKVKRLELDLKQLGQQMQERKTELMAEMGIDADAIEEEREDETA